MHIDLSVQNITKKFEDFTAVDSVSFQVEQGPWLFSCPLKISTPLYFWWVPSPHCPSIFISRCGTAAPR